MLTVTIPAMESWDEDAEMFVTTQREQTLRLEHSLVSLSKWESKWCKPFFTKTPKTREELLDYIQCMTVTQNVPPETFKHLPNSVIQQVNEYIDAPMTATTITDRRNGGGAPSRETITSELIYYWMIALEIPFECQKWHLNRLLMLIRVCNIKNTPPKKRSKGDILRENAALNAARRKRLNTRG